MLNLPLIFLVLSGSVYDETPMTINPDPSFLEGTYEEWIQSQPEYVPLTVTSIAGTDGADFVLIFEEGLTDSLEAGLLDQWTADIASQGLSTEVIEVTYSTPIEMKAYLTDKYNDGLEGAVLVGNLPAPWSAYSDSVAKSSQTFPSDYFYMDIDGTWEDNWIGYPFQLIPGSDGIYDTFSGTLDPEIYVGRIKVDNLTALGNPIEILNDYLERVHEWRLNGDPEPLNALCYVDDDWIPWAYQYQASMQYLYPNTELVSNAAATNGTDYLENRLPDNYVWISPFVHSSSAYHAWSPGPNTDWHELVPALPQAHFYNLFACSNARFTNIHSMGAVYAYCTESSLASVGSTKSGAMLHFTPFYSPLGTGSTLGEAYRDWWDYIAQGGLSPSELSWHLGMVVLGDPTLIPAMHMLGIEGSGGDALLPGITFMENPCCGVLSVSYPAEHGTLELYDTSGRLVATGILEDSACTLQVGSLNSGYYIARVTSSGGAAASASVVVLN
ncbi:MAG: C25 family cysteine peptidase [Candidatus Fermentibacteria bacterium]